MPSSASLTEPTDVAIAGAGIVGLAHALDAVRRGLSVVVVERDEEARGASVRNFGHGCFTAQSGESLEAAMAAREHWVSLSQEAGFWLDRSGSIVVAHAEDEMAVMNEFAGFRNGDVELLGRSDVLDRVPIAADGIVGGMWAPLDYRVDPREAVHALARWLADSHGVRFMWGTNVLGAETGVLHTTAGDVGAGAVVIAPGHHLDRLFPELARDAKMERCTLHMLRVAPPDRRPLGPALLTGLSLLRYRGYAECPSLDAVRERLAKDRPELLDAEVNLIITQRPDGDLVVGDTHEYARTSSPFQDERLDELLLEEASRLLGVDELRVRERWRGVYASTPDDEFFVAPIARGVRAVAITTGIGMTIAFGLAPRVLDELLEEIS